MLKNRKDRWKKIRIRRDAKVVEFVEKFRREETLSFETFALPFFFFFFFSFCLSPIYVIYVFLTKSTTTLFLFDRFDPEEKGKEHRSF